MDEPRDAHTAPLMEQLKLETLLQRRKVHITHIVDNSFKALCHPSINELYTKDTNNSKATETLNPYANVGRCSIVYFGPKEFNFRSFDVCIVSQCSSDTVEN